MQSHRKNLPFITAVMCALAVAAWFVGGAGTVLQLDRNALAQGKFWQLVTGHFVHWTGSHLLWDVLVFAILGAVVEYRSRAHFLQVVVLGALMISAGVLWFEPEVDLYRGLSGIDSALFAFVALRLAGLHLERRNLPGLLTVGFAATGFLAKSAVEWGRGESLFVDSSQTFQSLPIAHVLGASAGLASWLVQRALVIFRIRLARTAPRPPIVLSGPVT